MTKPTKPLLYNGYKLNKDISVIKRIEKIFFTEVYELSDGDYLYLFLDLKPEEIIDRSKKYKISKLQIDSNDYVAITAGQHSHEQVTKILEDLTSVHGLECVAGMKPLKRMLIEEIIEPLQNPEKFKKFKLSLPNGILLYGPPGCGKTFIVEKLAEELNYHFISLHGSSVATPYVHGAVSNIAQIFKEAESKAPSIVFIDEIEGLVPKREDLSGFADTKREEVNEFLVQLNNAGDKNILVVGATNQPELIDSALMRAGRMDKKIEVPPPDKIAREELFKIYLSGRPYSDDIDFSELAEMTKNYSCSDIRLIATEAAREAIKVGKEEIDGKIIRGVISNIPSSLSFIHK